MPLSVTTRRSFLSAVSTTVGVNALHALAGPYAAANPAPVESKSIRLGMPVFDAPNDPEELARAHKQLQLRAAYCPTVALEDRERIRDITAAFKKHDIVIAEVGRWNNLLESDPAKRKSNRDAVIEGLTLAEAIGARCCVNIAGSYNRDSWFGPHPNNFSNEFFDESVENARAIVDAVKPKRAKFCFEMMGWAIPDGPEVYRRLLKAVDRDAFAVHLDPSNLINSPTRYYRNTELLDNCFDILGPWIVSCHAKDVTWDVEMQMHFREVVVGQGTLDYKTYLKRIANLPNDVTLMIEHMKNASEYAASRDHIFGVGKQIGVQFFP